jgi:hypothetical protein
MRPEISMSNRNLSIDTDIAVLRRDTSAAARRATASADTTYGIEVLKAKGWVPLAGLFSKPKNFASLDDAVEACAAYWQRSGLAARPYQL